MVGSDVDEDVSFLDPNILSKLSLYFFPCPHPLSAGLKAMLYIIVTQHETITTTTTITSTSKESLIFSVSAVS